MAELLRQLRRAAPQKCVGLYGLPARPDLLSAGSATRLLCGRCSAASTWLVDGPFVLEKKDIALRFRARPTSRSSTFRDAGIGRIVLWDDGYQRGGHYDAKGTR